MSMNIRRSVRRFLSAGRSLGKRIFGKRTPSNSTLRKAIKNISALKRMNPSPRIKQSQLRRIISKMKLR